MSTQVPDKHIYDSYEFTTKDFEELYKEVLQMEENSQWIPGITSNGLNLSSIDAPLFIPDAVAEHKLDYETAFDTASEDGTKLILTSETMGKSWCVRDTARVSLYETAKLNGSALGRMAPCRLAETLNYGLEVARGSSLILERYGKASALHSDSNGGYCIMHISELLQISGKALKARFGVPKFVEGYNSHDYTSAMWELPDAQGDLISKYQAALANAASYNHAINFMPAVRFSSSDTATSSAMLVPYFKLPSGTYFRLCDGIKVKHKKSSSVLPEGIDLFKIKSLEVYARFNESMELIEKMGKTEIWNPENCIVGICNKLKIPKKYADAAREEVARFALNSTCCSVHDLYISLAECVGYARSMGASQKTIFDLEESIAKSLTMDWKDYDVGGIVSWGAAA